MCQIARKSTGKENFFFVTFFFTHIRTIIQPLHKKILQPIFFNFIIAFAKSNLTHLTIDVMFSGQRFTILAMFYVEKLQEKKFDVCNFFGERLRDFFVKRLHDFFGEVAQFS